jgi:hypothetical protein
VQEEDEEARKLAEEEQVQIHFQATLAVAGAATAKAAAQELQEAAETKQAEEDETRQQEKVEEEEARTACIKEWWEHDPSSGVCVHTYIYMHISVCLSVCLCAHARVYMYIRKHKLLCNVYT